MGIHDRGRIAILGYMTEWEYEHWDIRPSVNINMGLYDQGRIATLGYIKECGYQHGFI